MCRMNVNTNRKRAEIIRNLLSFLLKKRKKEKVCTEHSHDNC